MVSELKIPVYFSEVCEATTVALARLGKIMAPEQVAERIAEFEEAGVDLLLLQFSPQLEEMERFSSQVINNGLRAPAKGARVFASRELRRAANC